jgi:hypothetical protein
MTGARGVLEVGCNDAHEVVINHPDLKPDENGVGHIVFSPAQALELAKTLTKQAGLAIKARYEEQEKERIAILPPVDRSARTLTDGSLVTPDHRELKENGQQKGYVVLSEEERRKGFIRPVRRSYRHMGPSGPKNPLRDLRPDEVHHREYGYVKFEEYPKSVSGATGRLWTQEQLDKIDKGCGTVTSMGQALAETYARDPGFYSGTFCAGCGTHFPVGQDGEFVWLDDPSQRVGT